MPTPTLTLEISDLVKEQFPGHGVAYWAFDKGDPAELQTTAESLHTRFLASEDLRGQVETEIERWKEVFRAMEGRKVGDPSVATLYRMINARGEFPDWGPFVNYYNGLSMLSAVPMGAYDADKVEGPITLDFGESDLSFTPMGKADEKETLKAKYTRVKPKEVYYRDDSRILCRMWNYGDCDETKITNSTGHIWLFADLVGDEMQMSKTYDELSNLVQDSVAVTDTHMVVW